MKVLLPTLLMILLAAGCNQSEGTLPSAPAPRSAEPQPAASQPSPEPARFTPQEWLASPAYKKPNPYDLPLEYNIEVPELPPKAVMEPAKELPPAEKRD